ncbi:hypothetical protein EGI16_16390 [Chryseobacterium sp. G0240]|uniref:hypothetical protein n=1 Tax=Chryseobacterium sp. G0240 TaxID=2487066 RepID=UPI000F451E78|nr:hypothetical protein [Chryseobacterium sp. G0240]ROI01876.1 hypothetical protein EGI16_16390 [Chryseobacterium sp. G0240]
MLIAVGGLPNQAEIKYYEKRMFSHSLPMEECQIKDLAGWLFKKTTPAGSENQPGDIVDH